jgi:hypothetical protein
MPNDVPITSTVPGVFAADATGAGQGAIQNADGSYNNPSNQGRNTV